MNCFFIYGTGEGSRWTGLVPQLSHDMRVVSETFSVWYSVPKCRSTHEANIRHFFDNTVIRTFSGTRY